MEAADENPIQILLDMIENRPLPKFVHELDMDGMHPDRISEFRRAPNGLDWYIICNPTYWKHTARPIRFVGFDHYWKGLDSYKVVYDSEVLQIRQQVYVLCSGWVPHGVPGSWVMLEFKAILKSGTVFELALNKIYKRPRIKTRPEHCSASALNLENHLETIPRTEQGIETSTVASPES